MIDKKDIIKMAKHVFKRGKGVPDKRLMHPRRDWTIGMIVFALILIGGSYFGAVSYNQYKEIDTTGGDPGVTIPKYNASRIEETISLYGKLEEQFNMLTGNVVSAPKPDTETTTEEVVTQNASSSREAVGSGETKVDELNKLETTEADVSPGSLMVE